MDLHKVNPRASAGPPLLRLGIPGAFPFLVLIVLVWFGLFAPFSSRIPGFLFSGIMIGVFMLILISPAIGVFGSIRAGRDGIEIKRPFVPRKFVSWRRVIEMSISTNAGSREFVSREIPFVTGGWFVLKRSGPTGKVVETKFPLFYGKKQDPEVQGEFYRLREAFLATEEVVVSKGSLEANEPNASPYREGFLPTERLWELASDVHAEQELRLRAAAVLRERIGASEGDASLRQRINEIAAESVDESFTKELRARALGPLR